MDILSCVSVVRSFKTSKNDHIIEVQLHDDIDFICPYYPAKSSSSSSATPEYYTIYMVCIWAYIISILSVIDCSL